MTDPFKNETMMELIARKPGQLNILVAAMDCDEMIDGGRPFDRVAIRYRYTPIPRGAADARPVDADVPARLDTALGDYVADREAIDEVIGALRTEWTDVQQEIPVQDNSGTGRFDLWMPPA